MPTDPTPERVREIAEDDLDAGDLLRIIDCHEEPEFTPTPGPAVVLKSDFDALARQVIALREIAEEAANAWHAAQHGMENGPCLCPSHKVARARLDALAPVDGTR